MDDSEKEIIESTDGFGLSSMNGQIYSTLGNLGAVDTNDENDKKKGQKSRKDKIRQGIQKLNQLLPAEFHGKEGQKETLVSILEKAAEYMALMKSGANQQNDVLQIKNALESFASGKELEEMEASLNLITSSQPNNDQLGSTLDSSGEKLSNNALDSMLGGTTGNVSGTMSNDNILENMNSSNQSSLGKWETGSLGTIQGLSDAGFMGSNMFGDGSLLQSLMSPMLPGNPMGSMQNLLLTPFGNGAGANNMSLGASNDLLSSTSNSGPNTTGSSGSAVTSMSSSNDQTQSNQIDSSTLGHNTSFTTDTGLFLPSSSDSTGLLDSTTAIDSSSGNMAEPGSSQSTNTSQISSTGSMPVSSCSMTNSQQQQPTHHQPMLSSMSSISTQSQHLSTASSTRNTNVTFSQLGSSVPSNSVMGLDHTNSIANMPGNLTNLTNLVQGSANQTVVGSRGQTMTSVSASFTSQNSGRSNQTAISTHAQPVSTQATGQGFVQTSMCGPGAYNTPLLTLQPLPFGGAPGVITCNTNMNQLLNPANHSQHLAGLRPTLTSTANLSGLQPFAQNSLQQPNMLLQQFAQTNTAPTPMGPLQGTLVLHNGQLLLLPNNNAAAFGALSANVTAGGLQTLPTGSSGNNVLQTGTNTGAFFSNLSAANFAQNTGSLATSLFSTTVTGSGPGLLQTSIAGANMKPIINASGMRMVGVNPILNTSLAGGTGTYIQTANGMIQAAPIMNNTSGHVANAQGAGGQQNTVTVNTPQGVVHMNTTPSAPNQLPSALMLPNGQIVPVVTQANTGMVITSNAGHGLHGNNLLVPAHALNPGQLTIQTPGGTGSLLASGNQLLGSTAGPGLLMTTSVAGSAGSLNIKPNLNTSSATNLFGTKISASSVGGGSAANTLHYLPVAGGALQGMVRGAPLMIAAAAPKPLLAATVPARAAMQLPGVKGAIGVVQSLQSQQALLTKGSKSSQKLNTSLSTVKGGSSTGLPNTMQAMLTSDGNIILLPSGSSSASAASAAKTVLGKKNTGQRIIMPKPSSGTPVATIAPLLPGQPSSVMVTSSVATTAISSVAKSGYDGRPHSNQSFPGNLTVSIANSQAAVGHATPPQCNSSTTDILAKAAESIFYGVSPLGGVSPGSHLYNPANDDNPLQIDTTHGNSGMLESLHHVTASMHGGVFHTSTSLSNMLPPPTLPSDSKQTGAKPKSSKTKANKPAKPPTTKRKSTKEKTNKKTAVSVAPTVPSNLPSSAENSQHLSHEQFEQAVAASQSTSTLMSQFNMHSESLLDLADNLDDNDDDESDINDFSDLIRMPSTHAPMRTATVTPISQVPTVTSSARNVVVSLSASNASSVSESILSVMSSSFCDVTTTSASLLSQHITSSQSDLPDLQGHGCLLSTQSEVPMTSPSAPLVPSASMEYVSKTQETMDPTVTQSVSSLAANTFSLTSRVSSALLPGIAPALQSVVASISPPTVSSAASLSTPGPAQSSKSKKSSSCDSSNTTTCQDEHTNVDSIKSKSPNKSKTAAKLSSPKKADVPKKPEKTKATEQQPNVESSSEDTPYAEVQPSSARRIDLMGLTPMEFIQSLADSTSNGPSPPSTKSTKKEPSPRISFAKLTKAGKDRDPNLSKGDSASSGHESSPAKSKDQLSDKVVIQNTPTSHRSPKKGGERKASPIVIKPEKTGDSPTIASTSKISKDTVTGDKDTDKDVPTSAVDSAANLPNNQTSEVKDPEQAKLTKKEQRRAEREKRRQKAKEALALDNKNSDVPEINDETVNSEKGVGQIATESEKNMKTTSSKDEVEVKNDRKESKPGSSSSKKSSSKTKKRNSSGSENIFMSAASVASKSPLFSAGSTIFSPSLTLSMAVSPFPSPLAAPHPFGFGAPAMFPAMPIISSAVGALPAFGHVPPMFAQHSLFATASFGELPYKPLLGNSSSPRGGDTTGNVFFGGTSSSTQQRKEDGKKLDTSRSPGFSESRNSSFEEIGKSQKAETEPKKQSSGKDQDKSAKSKKDSSAEKSESANLFTATANASSPRETWLSFANADATKTNAVNSTVSELDTSTEGSAGGKTKRKKEKKKKKDKRNQSRERLESADVSHEENNEYEIVQHSLLSIDAVPENSNEKEPKEDAEQANTQTECPVESTREKSPAKKRGRGRKKTKNVEKTGTELSERKENLPETSNSDVIKDKSANNKQPLDPALFLPDLNQSVNFSPTRSKHSSGKRLSLRDKVDERTVNDSTEDDGGRLIDRPLADGISDSFTSNKDTSLETDPELKKPEKKRGRGRTRKDAKVKEQESNAERLLSSSQDSDAVMHTDCGKKSQSQKPGALRLKISSMTSPTRDNEAYSEDSTPQRSKHASMSPPKYTALESLSARGRKRRASTSPAKKAPGISSPRPLSLGQKSGPLAMSSPRDKSTMDVFDFDDEPEQGLMPVSLKSFSQSNKGKVGGELHSAMLPEHASGEPDDNRLKEVATEVVEKGKRGRGRKKKARNEKVEEEECEKSEYEIIASTYHYEPTEISEGAKKNTETDETSAKPVKRGRGRPKGSGTKSKASKSMGITSGTNVNADTLEQALTNREDGETAKSSSKRSKDSVTRPLDLTIQALHQRLSSTSPLRPGFPVDAHPLSSGAKDESSPSDTSTQEAPKALSKKQRLLGKTTEQSEEQTKDGEEEPQNIPVRQGAKRGRKPKRNAKLSESDTAKTEDESPALDSTGAAKRIRLSDKEDGRLSEKEKVPPVTSPRASTRMSRKRSHATRNSDSSAERNEREDSASVTNSDTDAKAKGNMPDTITFDEEDLFDVLDQVETADTSEKEGGLCIDESGSQSATSSQQLGDSPSPAKKAKLSDKSESESKAVDNSMSYSDDQRSSTQETVDSGAFTPTMNASKENESERSRASASKENESESSRASNVTTLDKKEKKKRRKEKLSVRDLQADTELEEGLIVSEPSKRQEPKTNSKPLVMETKDVSDYPLFKIPQPVSVETPPLKGNPPKSIGRSASNHLLSRIPKKRIDAYQMEYENATKANSSVGDNSKNSDLLSTVTQPQETSSDRVDSPLQFGSSSSKEQPEEVTSNKSSGLSSYLDNDDTSSKLRDLQKFAESGSPPPSNGNNISTSSTSFNLATSSSIATSSVSGVSTPEFVTPTSENIVSTKLRSTSSVEKDVSADLKSSTLDFDYVPPSPLSSARHSHLGQLAQVSRTMRSIAMPASPRPPPSSLGGSSRTSGRKAKEESSEGSLGKSAQDNHSSHRQPTAKPQSHVTNSDYDSTDLPGTAKATVASGMSEGAALDHDVLSKAGSSGDGSGTRPEVRQLSTPPPYQAEYPPSELFSPPSILPHDSMHNEPDRSPTPVNGVGSVCGLEGGSGSKTDYGVSTGANDDAMGSSHTPTQGMYGGTYLDMEGASGQSGNVVDMSGQRTDIFGSGGSNKSAQPGNNNLNSASTCALQGTTPRYDSFSPPYAGSSGPSPMGPANNQAGSGSGNPGSNHSNHQMLSPQIGGAPGSNSSSSAVEGGYYTPASVGQGQGHYPSFYGPTSASLSMQGYGMSHPGASEATPSVASSQRDSHRLQANRTPVMGSGPDRMTSPHPTGGPKSSIANNSGSSSAAAAYNNYLNAAAGNTNDLHQSSQTQQQQRAGTGSNTANSSGDSQHLSHAANGGGSGSEKDAHRSGHNRSSSSGGGGGGHSRNRSAGSSSLGRSPGSDTRGQYFASQYGTAQGSQLTSPPLHHRGTESDVSLIAAQRPTYDPLGYPVASAYASLAAYSSPYDTLTGLPQQTASQHHSSHSQQQQKSQQSHQSNSTSQQQQQQQQANTSSTAAKNLSTKQAQTQRQPQSNQPQTQQQQPNQAQISHNTSSGGSVKTSNNRSSSSKKKSSSSSASQSASASSKSHYDQSAASASAMDPAMFYDRSMTYAPFLSNLSSQSTAAAARQYDSTNYWNMFTPQRLSAAQHHNKATSDPFHMFHSARTAQNGFGSFNTTGGTGGIHHSSHSGSGAGSQASIHGSTGAHHLSGFANYMFGDMNSSASAQDGFGMSPIKLPGSNLLSQHGMDSASAHNAAALQHHHQWSNRASQMLHQHHMAAGWGYHPGHFDAAGRSMSAGINSSMTGAFGSQGHAHFSMPPFLHGDH